MSQREGRYLLRIPMGRLRLGVGDVTVLDGLSWSVTGDKSLRPELERAYNISCALGLVDAHVQERRRESFGENLCHRRQPDTDGIGGGRAKTSEEIIERLGKCAIEPKVDGFRCQCHKEGEHVRMFSRNLEETTTMFPDIAEAVVKQVKAKNVILEGEAIGYDPDTGEFAPFQVTVSRKRKYGIEEMRKTIHCACSRSIYYTSTARISRGSHIQPATKKLIDIIKKGDGIAVIENRLTDDPKMVDAFFMEKIESGLEGIMAKRLDSTYQAGARNFNWIKFKRSYQGHLRDTVDVVVIGYLRGREIVVSSSVRHWQRHYRMSGSAMASFEPHSHATSSGEIGLTKACRPDT